VNVDEEDDEEEEPFFQHDGLVWPASSHSSVTSIHHQLSSSVSLFLCQPASSVHKPCLLTWTLLCVSSVGYCFPFSALTLLVGDRKDIGL